MANKSFLPITDVKNVPGASASGTLRATLANTGRLMNVKACVSKGGALATANEIRTAITEVRLILINGQASEVVRRLTAAQAMVMLSANNYPLPAGFFGLFFAEPFRATVQDEEILSLDLSRYSSVVIEMDVTNTATPLAFSFRQEFDDRLKIGSDGKPVNMFLSHTRQTEIVGGGTPLIKFDPLNGPLQRLHVIVPSGSVLSRVRLLQGQTPIYDITQTATDTGLTFQLQDMGLVIPAAFTTAAGTFNSWPVIPDNNQQLRNSIDDYANLNMELTLDVGCTVHIIRETKVAR